ncbi:hypothetical protein [Alienimonas sp. DA493]|uniref:hypothetical protein n=1 Tax=Alienimonas sp. DA493 TaxID=3373605 RepID=UPI00375493D2
MAVGVIPIGGPPLSHRVWATIFEITPNRMTKVLKECNVPHRRRGNEFYARPDDIWEALPCINWPETE